jgi:hypothetical protein
VINLINIEKEIKKILIDENLNVSKLANLLNTSSQNLTAKLKRNNLKLNDIQEIANALGYHVEISFKKN